MNLPFLSRARAPVIPVLRLKGPIGAAGRFGGGLNDAALAPLIEQAFAMKPKAVALAINSPGGSPVQSALIAARIRRLALEKNVPVLAFVEDAAASGGYWLACAADEIYCDASSLIGSIGVISSGFGFADLIAEHGIERRVYTAGRAKSVADPFLPEKPEDVARLRMILEPLHANFIAYVKERRGARLDLETPELFEGAFWAGAQAQKIGLVDGVGHLRPILQARYGSRLRLREIERRRGLLSRVGLKAGAEAMMEVAEARALWARIGL